MSEQLAHYEFSVTAIVSRRCQHEDAQIVGNHNSRQQYYGNVETVSLFVDFLCLNLLIDDECDRCHNSSCDLRPVHNWKNIGLSHY